MQGRLSVLAFCVGSLFVLPGCIIEELGAEPKGTQVPVPANDDGDPSTTVFELGSNVPIRYLGTWETIDEYARPVNAHHFLSSADDVHDDLRGVYAFEAATGRLLHREGELSRSFWVPGDWGIFGTADEAALFSFLLVPHLADTTSATVAGYSYTMEKTDRTDGLACTTYRITWKPVVLGEPGLLVCLITGSTIPLRTEAYHADLSVVSKWTGDSFTPPALAGEPLPSFSLARAPWNPVTLAGVRTQAPPDGYDGEKTGSDYESQAEGLLRSPKFLSYARSHPDATPTMVFETFGTCALACPWQPSEPDWSWWIVADEEDGFWQTVRTFQQPADEWVPGEPGHDLGVGLDGTSAPDDGVVPFGAISTRYGDLVSRHPNFRVFHVFPHTIQQTTPWTSTWMIFPTCQPEERFAFVSAVNGQLLADGVVQVHANGCSGSGFEEMSQRGWVPSGYLDRLPEPARRPFV